MSGDTTLPPYTLSELPLSVYDGPFAGCHRLAVQVPPVPDGLRPDTVEYWAARGLPDPATVSTLEFVQACQANVDDRTRWPLSVARTGAAWLFKRLRQAEHRAALIVGSIRRCKDVVGDIEIVIEPATLKADLFSQGRAMDDVLAELVLEGALIHRSKNAGERMKRFYLETKHLFGTSAMYPRIKVEIHIVAPPAQYGVYAAIRTGPFLYSKWLVTQQHKKGACPDGYYFDQGAIWKDGATEPLPMPEETDLFRFLGLPYPDPIYRGVQKPQEAS